MKMFRKDIFYLTAHLPYRHQGAHARGVGGGGRRHHQLAVGAAGPRLPAG